MAASYNRVLEEARTLSPEDQQKLVQELTRPTPPPENGKVRTLYDAFNERGLIGFMTDAPEDLSTNPKYMEGFGQDAR